MKRVYVYLWFFLLVAACQESVVHKEEKQKEPSPVIDAGTRDAVASDVMPDGVLADTTAKEQRPEPTSEPVPQTKPFPPIDGSQVLKDENPDPNVVEVRLRAYSSRIQMSDKIAQIMYTYNGIIPGPIIRARLGNRVIVHFENDLPEPTTIHWHGLRISDKMDGSPRIQKPVPAGGTFTYSFIVREAGSFWYHPHVRSHEQVEKGLYGMLVVQEKENIAFDMERSVVLDDILLVNERLAGFLKSHAEIMHGRNGNYLFANGKITPKVVTVKAGSVERWRLVNVANARTMTLQFKGVKARVIGTDGGLIPTPYKLDKYLTVTVGQRFDLEVTFDTLGEFALELVTPARGGGVNSYPMLKVKVVGDAAKTAKPPVYPDIQALPKRNPDRTVDISFDGVQDRTMPGGVAWRLNKRARWTEPMFTFKQGETVDMRLKNLNNQPHPFHLHGQFFTVLTRNGKAADEPGLKDSVLLLGSETLVIRAYLDNPGQWMAHCHILEHAELGMMAEIVVTPTP